MIDALWHLKIILNLLQTLTVFEQNAENLCNSFVLLTTGKESHSQP